MTEDDEDPKQILLEFIQGKETCSTQEVIKFIKDERLEFGMSIFAVLKQEVADGKIKVDWRQGTVSFVP